MATHTALIEREGEDTLVRISGRLTLPYGAATVREVETTGEVILAPIPETSQVDTWAAFLDDLSSRPRDEEFMKERPMNHPPIEMNLFPEG